ncbi:competence/damage-inducible protein A [Pedobacter sp. BS3]|uniref:competence/damage-inducible protein A n=1 Tax=Pedobacter sp. BS3 TaxID=2567937 RepID=UPI0011F012C8|nr:competence/damage-inducible protein A [Pedobacter sp. BS3]TZF83775.1 competence/damage-inducible protein A [Pedobacter sp. BS3]
MQAEIITIGDELLIGQVIDTNSAWIATGLNDRGIRVKQITSVSDDAGHITEALNAAAKRANIIIMTGGLGPTKDDITKKTLARYFNVGFKRDEATLKNVERIFSRTNRPMLEINRMQADVPENCTVLLNENGTAPGMWFEFDDNVLVSLPGVPHEMKYLMQQYVYPRLQARFKMGAIVHQTILTAGLGESYLAEQIADIEDRLPAHIRLAYLPKLGNVRLRLSGYGDDLAAIEQEISRFTSEITKRLSDHVIATQDIAIEEAILNLMLANNLKLAVAESCTGGYLSHLITQHPGCSAVFLGGAVSYSNALKQRMLGVSPETLEQYGAVSQQTVEEMAKGVISHYNADYSIAISGIAGPDGGTPDKPVGTVWIAVANRDKIIARQFIFGSKRIQNIERSAVAGLALLFQLLREEVQINP